MPKNSEIYHHYCLDLGGSTIDMVKFSDTTISDLQSIESQKFFSHAKNDISLEDIIQKFGKTKDIKSQKNLTITGGRSQKFPEKFVIENSEISLTKVSEFEAIAAGGMFLSGENSGLVVSLGTGTAMVSVTDMKKNQWKHVRGTGIGGGTFLGLGRAILKIQKFSELQKLSETGNLQNIDISVEDILGGSLGNLTPEMTASNFGKFSPENSQPEDIALALANLVGQSIASLAIEKAKVHGHTKIILGGKISRFSVVTECIKKTAKFFDIEIIIPENSGYMTAVGGAIIEKN